MCAGRTLRPRCITTHLAPSRVARSLLLDGAATIGDRIVKRAMPSVLLFQDFPRRVYGRRPIVSVPSRRSVSSAPDGSSISATRLI
jgi:hypothetical protein